MSAVPLHSSCEAPQNAARPCPSHRNNSTWEVLQNAARPCPLNTTTPPTRRHRTVRAHVRRAATTPGGRASRWVISMPPTNYMSLEPRLLAASSNVRCRPQAAMRSLRRKERRRRMRSLMLSLGPLATLHRTAPREARFRWVASPWHRPGSCHGNCIREKQRQHREGLSCKHDKRQLLVKNRILAAERGGRGDAPS